MIEVYDVSSGHEPTANRVVVGSGKQLQGRLQITDDMIHFESSTPLQTLSSGVTGAGLGWYQTFINRSVGTSYQNDHYKREMASYLIKHGFHPRKTVGMMTAVYLKNVSYEYIEGDRCAVFVVVTAGVSNAVDAAHGDKHIFTRTPGTINTWVFVDGQLAPEAFIQCIVTATEAKTKALREAYVMDHVTKTLATGTSTDSILIASTEKGQRLDFGGPISPLGQLVGKGVFNCTQQALDNYFDKENSSW
ncbi:MAG TPA: adenosylcobinamide amidohydrolase [Bacillota bacterium]